jgi:ketosteroid isomerase-like protein
VASAPQPVQIAFFVASASQIEQGQSTTLQWQTSNAKEVSIDNGIARVDSSGQTTVQPQSTTTYTLTAAGNGGSQQKSITIEVQPKQVAVAQPAPVVQQPQPQQPADPTAQIREALNSFNSAFNAADAARMQQAWPSMSGAQLSGFKTFFQQNPGSKVSDDCPASGLTISGDAATWSCTETMTLMTGGKAHPSQHRMLIAFAKKNGSWVIGNRQ